MRSLILLHGALGAPAQLQPLAGALAPHYDIHIPALPGHAGMKEEHFGIPFFSGFLKSYIQEKGLDNPLVFGYSMGGYVALYSESRWPGLLGGIATLATKLAWDPQSAAKESRMLQPEIMKEKVPAFVATLQQRHAPLDWKEVVTNTATMMQELGGAPLLGEDEFVKLDLPVFLLLGDRDNMVTLDETLTAYRTIPGAQLALLPGTSHPIEKVDPELLAFLLHRYFEKSINKV
jgi:pimeloyl-ACP methyl ester carboxylesterase